VTLGSTELPSVALSIDLKKEGNITSGRFAASKGISYSTTNKWVSLKVTQADLEVTAANVMQLSTYEAAMSVQGELVFTFPKVGTIQLPPITFNKVRL
jgi:hypothetical protein